MKLITAIIQPDRLDDVREALIDADISRITISRCSGHGQAQEFDLYRGQQIIPNLISKIRIDIAVNDEFVDITCDTIVRAAKTKSGKVGDGKIFVTALEKCIRIRTEETDNVAI